MKEQNQISEAAKKAVMKLVSEGLMSYGSLTAERIIQSAIDAANAEVKKEGSKKGSGFADNTDAVHSNSHEETDHGLSKSPMSETPATRDVQREQAGLLPCPFCGGLDPHIDVTQHENVFMVTIICRNVVTCGASVTASLVNEQIARDCATLQWNRRAASQSTPSQAPTDSSRKQEASGLAARVEPTKEETA